MSFLLFIRIMISTKMFECIVIKLRIYVSTSLLVIQAFIDVTMETKVSPYKHSPWIYISILFIFCRNVPRHAIRLGVYPQQIHVRVNFVNVYPFIHNYISFPFQMKIRRQARHSLSNCSRPAPRQYSVFLQKSALRYDIGLIKTRLSIPHPPFFYVRSFNLEGGGGEIKGLLLFKSDNNMICTFQIYILSCVEFVMLILFCVKYSIFMNV